MTTLRAPDLLTSSRVLIGLLAIPLIDRGGANVALLVVAVGWMTDIADGRVARHLGLDGQSRLPFPDVWADWALATGVCAGVALHGSLPLWVIAAPILVASFSLAAPANPLPPMIGVFAAYAPASVPVAVDADPWAWALFALFAATVFAVGYQKIVGVTAEAWASAIAGLAGDHDTVPADADLYRWAGLADRLDPAFVRFTSVLFKYVVGGLVVGLAVHATVRLA